MSEAIFWDAWAFIALVDHSYRLHKVALDIAIELNKLGTYMVTTEAVLSEVGDMFSKRQVRHLVRATFELVTDYLSEERASILSVDHDLWQAGWDLYVDRPDKDWGHTDCISFVTMSAFGILKAFTGDHHFEQAGFVRLVRP